MALVSLDELQLSCDARNTLREYVREHGYAIVSVPTEMAQIFRQTTDSAASFFGYTEEVKRATQQLFYEVPPHKGLLGYNRPSEAKEVFRIRRGAYTKWPQGDFKQQVLKSFDCLEKIVELTMIALLEPFDFDYDTLLKDTCDDVEHLDKENFSSSPFDIFHYFNVEEDTTEPKNCSIHVDPGYLTVVPCCQVPGLVLRSRREKDWIQAEVDQPPFEQVCIFPAAGLQVVSRNYYEGTVHYVSKNPEMAPRLSLVYELRPKASYNVTTFVKKLRNK
mmetsp:Transcript_10464/g.11513  ORF Transcript_10464/g.11513 Transcript_10464/m.11513 type:complete len:276 (-) Transcript_10464:12-839(-)